MRATLERVAGLRILQLLAQRPGLGQQWSPDGIDTIEVSPATSERLDLTFPRPRRVDIELRPAAGSTAPPRWVVSDGRFQRDARGANATVWLTEESTKLRILDTSHRVIGTTSVPAGTEPATIIAQLTQ